jgi:hypothetical protein
MADQPSDAPKEKQFSLKPNETSLLHFVREKQEAVFSGILSTIAAERLSYQVTDRTQMKLNADLTEIVFTELPPPPEEPQDGPQEGSDQPEPPKQPPAHQAQAPTATNQPPADDGKPAIQASPSQ